MILPIREVPVGSLVRFGVNGTWFADFVEYKESFEGYIAKNNNDSICIIGWKTGQRTTEPSFAHDNSFGYYGDYVLYACIMSNTLCQYIP